jgi:hypothetical protein
VTWWLNPTDEQRTVTALDDDNVVHTFTVAPHDVAEIPSKFDRAVQYRWGAGSPMIGCAPMFVRVDEATVLAAKAEALKPTPLPKIEAHSFGGSRDEHKAKPAKGK